MSGIWKIVVSLSLSGSLFLLVLLLCKPLYKNRISRQWQYYIWLVVIARLLLPFTPQASPVGILFQEVERAVDQMNTVPSPGWNPEIVSQPDYEPEIDRTVDPAVAEETSEAALQGGNLPDAISLSVRQVSEILLQAFWIVVAVILLIRKITIYQGFVHYIKAGRVEISDPALLDRLAQIAEQNGIRKPVELYTNSLVSSPLLLGFFRPCIVLPGAGLPASDFEYTILHELMHYKRRDMFYKWLVQITVCLHWFNPLVYRMGREINRACELACDEAVIKRLDEKGRRAYGDTLLNAVGAGGGYKDSLACVTLGESRELLRERLDAIMRYKGKSKLMFAIAFLLTLVLCAGVVAFGAYRNTGSTAIASHNNSTVASERDIESADLDFSIESAAVEVLPASDKKITVHYNRDLYSVTIQEKEDDKWSVKIAGKTGDNIGNNPVQVCLPDADYGAVSFLLESASFDCGAISSGNMVSTINTSFVHFVLPAGFSGSFQADATDGYFELHSQDRYVDSAVTADGNVSVPDYFTRDGIFSTYTNGSGENVIEVTAVGGYAEIN